MNQVHGGPRRFHELGFTTTGTFIPFDILSSRLWAYVDQKSYEERQKKVLEVQKSARQIRNLSEAEQVRYVQDHAWIASGVRERRDREWECLVRYSQMNSSSSTMGPGFSGLPPVENIQAPEALMQEWDESVAAVGRFVFSDGDDGGEDDGSGAEEENCDEE